MLPAIAADLLFPILMAVLSEKVLKDSSGRPSKLGRGLLGASLVSPTISTVEGVLGEAENWGFDPMGRRARMGRSIQSQANLSILDDLDMGLQEGMATRYGGVADELFRADPTFGVNEVSNQTVDQVLLDRIVQGREVDLHRASLTSMPSLQEIAARAGLAM